MVRTAVKLQEDGDVSGSTKAQGPPGLGTPIGAEPASGELEPKGSQLKREHQHSREEPVLPSEIGCQVSNLLAGLKTVEPQGINTMADDEWVEVEVTVDSGASQTVIGEKTLNGVIGISEGPAFGETPNMSAPMGSKYPTSVKESLWDSPRRGRQMQSPHRFAQ